MEEKAISQRQDRKAPQEQKEVSPMIDGILGSYSLMKRTAGEPLPLTGSFWCLLLRNFSVALI